MYLARELTEHSLPEIGRGIGGRNHTTVLHAVNRVSAAMRTDDSCANAVDNLRRRLGRPSSLTGVNGRINSFRTWAIALPKPHRSGYPPLNSPPITSI